MIAHQPRLGISGPWHVSSWPHSETLCGIPTEPFIKRDPFTVEKYHGTRCDACWTEWGLRTAASYARQDQYEASHA